MNLVSTVTILHIVKNIAIISVFTVADTNDLHQMKEKHTQGIVHKKLNLILKNQKIKA